jgi:hypothetical protein
LKPRSATAKRISLSTKIPKFMMSTSDSVGPLNAPYIRPEDGLCQSESI